MKTVFIPALISISFLCLGCMPFHALEHRAPDEETLASIKEGVTSKVDVLMMLGEPDRVMEKERFFQYWWNEIYAINVWADVVGYAYSLHIYFDENNVIKKFEIKKKFGDMLRPPRLPDIFILELYAGNYMEMEAPNVSEIELKENGKGVWRMPGKETALRWSIGDNEIRLKTESGVIVGQINDDILEVSLPAGSGYKHFKKVK